MSFIVDNQPACERCGIVPVFAGGLHYCAGARAQSVNQPDLWSEPPVQRHSPTSRAAAEQIKPSRRRMSDRVLAYIALHGPVSDEQIARGLEMNPSSARPRRVELSRRGEIVLAGETLTASGRRASTWRVA